MKENAAAVRLQLFAPDDYDRLLSWVDTPEAMKDWSGAFFEYPLTVEQLEHYTAEAAEGKRIIFSVFDGALHVGHVELSNKVPYHSCFLSRILVAPTERGRGYGEVMIRKLLAVAFEEHDLHFVTLGVIQNNVGALALYKKLGFEILGERSVRLNTPTGPEKIYWMMLKRADWRSNA